MTGPPPPASCAAVYPPAGRLWFAFAVMLVAFVYISTYSTLPSSVFWSPDEGAKFIQMLSGVNPGDTVCHPAYGGAANDPLYIYYPKGDIYPAPVWPAGTRLSWPNAFPAASLPLFRAFGAGGLYIIPLGGGILTAAVAGLLARRITPAAAIPAVLMAGLASPLMFLSMLFMEHTPTAALGLGALCCVLTIVYGPASRQPGAAVGVFLCLAGMLALRHESVILAAAMAGGAIMAAKRWKRTTLLAVAIPSGAAALAIAAVCVAVPGSRTLSLLGDSLRGLATLASPEPWLSIPRHLLAVLINNPDQSGVPLPPEWVTVAMAGLGLCALSGLAIQDMRLPCWLAGAILVGMAAAVGLAEPERYRAIHGLLLPMPALVLVWMPAPVAATAGTGPQERWLRSFLTAVVILYLAVTWLLRRPDGGPEWGLRYALVVYLLAAVLGAVALIRFLAAHRGWRRVSGAVTAAGLLGLSCAFNARGIVEIQVAKRDLHAFETEIVATARPVVTDQWWLAAALAPVFVKSPFYTLNDACPFDVWLDRLGRHTPTFLHISYTPPPHVMASHSGAGAVITRQRRIQAMILSTYTVR